MCFVGFNNLLCSFEHAIQQVSVKIRAPSVSEGDDDAIGHRVNVFDFWCFRLAHAEILVALSGFRGAVGYIAITITGG